ncbi:MAG: GAF domain-containing protein, partial [Microcoleus sp. SIO2G3]|nr:GAF domain-containing protein [Microcoleus sp. SIO2G3]
MFERLQELLQVWSSTLGEGVVVLTHKKLSSRVVAPENQEQRFTAVVSKKFSALLLGTPQSEPFNGNGATAPLYQVGLTFEPDAIASFLTQLAHQLENASDTLKLASITQASIQPNDAAIQSEFTLALLELLSSEESHHSVPPNSDNSRVYACQPLVEEALRHQVEQERLLHQVTTQIRQSLELPVILKTAVEQVRHFLQVDRLVIYQFDFQPLEQKSEFKASSIDLDVEEKILPIGSSSKEIAPSAITTESAPIPLASKLNWGCVTYEARASDSIVSVLNLVEEQDCSIHVPNCRERYRQGLTVAIDDVESAYAASPCLLNMLEQMQVRAKLIAPIVVQNNLWGLLIAHQCLEARYWQ